jgi:hypothetical protein
MISYTIYTIKVTDEGIDLLTAITPLLDPNDSVARLSEDYYLSPHEQGSSRVKRLCEVGENEVKFYEDEFSGQLDLPKLARTLGTSLDVHEFPYISTDGDLYDQGDFYTVELDGTYSNAKTVYFDPRLDRMVEVPIQF